MYTDVISSEVEKSPAVETARYAPAPAHLPAQALRLAVAHRRGTRTALSLRAKRGNLPEGKTGASEPTTPKHLPV